MIGLNPSTVSSFQLKVTIGVIDVTPSELYFNFLRYSAQAKEFFIKGKKLAFDSMHLSGAIMDYKV